MIQMHLTGDTPKYLSPKRLLDCDDESNALV